MQPSGSAAHLEAVVKPFFFSTGAARIVSKELQVILKVTMNEFFSRVRNGFSLSNMWGYYRRMSYKFTCFTLSYVGFFI